MRCPSATRGGIGGREPPGQGQDDTHTLNTRTQTEHPRRKWFPEFGFILQYRNHLEPSETDIPEAEALSNQYCVAAWSVEEATPGVQKKLLRLPAVPQISFPFALTNFTR